MDENSSVPDFINFQAVLVNCLDLPHLPDLRKLAEISSNFNRL